MSDEREGVNEGSIRDGPDPLTPPPSSLWWPSSISSCLSTPTFSLSNHVESTGGGERKYWGWKEKVLGWQEKVFAVERKRIGGGKRKYFGWKEKVLGVA